MKIIEQHTVPAISTKIRLQEYAATIFETITTRSGIKKAVKRGEILLNDQTAHTSDWIEEGQTITLLQPDVKEKKIFKLKLAIVFEDEYLAIIEKPAGYPTNGNYFKTIENALPHNLEISTKKDALPYPLPVHRLDNPTSGLLIVAKTKKAQTTLHQNFEERKIQKTYLALVEGKTPPHGEFNTFIDGKPALTNFNSLNHLLQDNKVFSLVELFPLTGRTHQLRIHLSLNSFPIVGDEMYNSTIAIKKGIFLQAYSLQLKHPITRKKLDLKASLGKKFIKFIEGSQTLP